MVVDLLLKFTEATLIGWFYKIMAKSSNDEVRWVFAEFPLIISLKCHE